MSDNYFFCFIGILETPKHTFPFLNTIGQCTPALEIHILLLISHPACESGYRALKVQAARTRWLPPQCSFRYRRGSAVLLICPNDAKQEESSHVVSLTLPSHSEPSPDQFVDTGASIVRSRLPRPGTSGGYPGECAKDNEGKHIRVFSPEEASEDPFPGSCGTTPVLRLCGQLQLGVYSDG